MATQNVSSTPRTCSRRVDSRVHELSPNCVWLVKLMQSIKYGCIPKLRIRNGEPIIDGSLKVDRTVKICASESARRKACTDNFVVREEVLDMLDQFRQIDDGTIKELKIVDGLPVSFRVRETVHFVC